MQPFWKWLPVAWAHALAPFGLSVFASFFGAKEPLNWKAFNWKGIAFRNRLGIAGGIDKNATQALDWDQVGAGFVEVGTVTLRPQSANPGKIMDRSWVKKTLWNKMGFPSLGAEEVYYNLLHISSDCRIPVFVNIGKNRDTSNENASDDYKLLAEKFAPLAAALVVNVSSPNTSGLRDLQADTELKKIIEKVVSAAGKKPVLVKLSPDQSESQLQGSLDASLQAGAQGFILTNTTLSREGYSEFPKEGGLSGQAVAKQSLLTLQRTIHYLGPRRDQLLIISAGGVMTAQDVKERLSLGADLVQVYSALVFEGPGFFRKISQEFTQ